MARIKIKDLPKGMKVTKEEMRKVRAGMYPDRASGTGPVYTFNWSPLQSSQFLTPIQFPGPQ